MKLGDLHHGGILMMTFGKPLLKATFCFKIGKAVFWGSLRINVGRDVRDFCKQISSCLAQS